MGMIMSLNDVFTSSELLVKITSAITFASAVALASTFLKKIYISEKETQAKSGKVALLPHEKNEDELNLEDRKPGHLWNTAMFFPDYSASMRDSTTQQFLWYFAQARTSIRGCIYNFSFPELESVIVQQYNAGLVVQFVVGTQSTADKLRKSSIPCGINPRRKDVPDTDQLMHHKFVIIDDEAVLVGSMNWTFEGVTANKENVVVSTNPSHVKKYLDEFLRLQRMCEDNKSYY